MNVDCISIQRATTLNSEGFGQSAGNYQSTEGIGKSNEGRYIFLRIFSPKTPIELYFFSSNLQLSIESACLNYLKSSVSVDRNRLESRTTYY